MIMWLHFEEFTNMQLIPNIKDRYMKPDRKVKTTFQPGITVPVLALDCLNLD